MKPINSAARMCSSVAPMSRLLYKSHISMKSCPSPSRLFLLRAFSIYLDKAEHITEEQEWLDGKGVRPICKSSVSSSSLRRLKGKAEVYLRD